jgi:hypothetical protein
MQETTTTLAIAVRQLAEQWRVEGCKKFDDGNTPTEVAEAAGKLRCALELSELLKVLERDTRDCAPSALHAIWPSAPKESP